MTDRLSQRLIDKVPQALPTPDSSGFGAFEGLQSASIADLVAAKAKADITLRNVRKGSANPFFKSDYADLDAITRIVRGQWIRSVMPIDAMPDKNGVITPQATGSAITYAKRYALAAMANLAQTDEDDDGEAAMGRPAENPATPQEFQEEHVAPFDLADFGDKAGLPDTEDISVEERLKRLLEACKTKADLDQWESEHRATLAQMESTDAAATERLRVVYAKTKNKGG